MLILREDARDKEALEVIKMEKTYLDYIKEHVNNVQQAYRDLFFGKSLFTDPNIVSEEELTATIYSLADDINHHDESKYSDEEFHAYRKHYYPTTHEQDMMNNDESYKQLVEDEYQKAWDHHASHNDHHPKYWKFVNGQFDENNIPRDMTLGSIIHAICDWEAMSRKFNTDTIEWYNEKADKEKSYMTEKTRAIFDHLLPIVFKK